MKKTLIYTTLILGAFAVSCQNKSSEPSIVKVASVEGITIATIDTDVIFENFDMVADMMRELEATERRLMDDLQRQARSWQTDMENYLQIGATLTLSEQRRREEQLERRREELQQLEQRYAQQMMEVSGRKNQEMQDHIFAFVEEFNKTNGNFTIILSKARGSGVLYALPSLDITGPILEALNAEYAQNRRVRR